MYIGNFRSVQTIYFPLIKRQLFIWYSCFNKLLIEQLYSLKKWNKLEIGFHSRKKRHVDIMENLVCKLRDVVLQRESLRKYFSFYLTKSKEYLKISLASSQPLKTRGHKNVCRPGVWVYIWNLTVYFYDYKYVNTNKWWIWCNGHYRM